MKVSLAATVLLLCVSAFGQLEIRIPQQRYKEHDRIDVVIANTSTKQVPFCVEYGHSSFRDADHGESTPTPVYVQRKDKRKEKLGDTLREWRSRARRASRLDYALLASLRLG